jgi:hypothetical protein
MLGLVIEVKPRGGSGIQGHTVENVLSGSLLQGAERILTFPFNLECNIKPGQQLTWDVTIAYARFEDGFVYRSEPGVGEHIDTRARAMYDIASSVQITALTATSKNDILSALANIEAQRLYDPAAISRIREYVNSNAIEDVKSTLRRVAGRRP